MYNTVKSSSKKKTFSLILKNDFEVKTLEDLRENFDLEKAVKYFKSGELLQWLEDRFYDDEAEALENISANDKNLSQKLCAALGVECDDDLEFIRRIREKKKFLMEKTDDENIIDNAVITALNQDDLANLLHLDYPTIYLCGENFSVPIRISDKKYIGVLSTPKIKIRANSDEELAAKKIVFENCKLAWRQETPMEALKALASRLFGLNGVWQIINQYYEVVSNYDKLSKAEKTMARNLCCSGKYKESEIVFMMFREDLSDGFALTTDAFCTGGTSGGNIINYKVIKDIQLDSFDIVTENNTNSFSFKYDGILRYNRNIAVQVKKFLDVVKNL